MIPQKFFWTKVPEGLPVPTEPKWELRARKDMPEGLDGDVDLGYEFKIPHQEGSPLCLRPYLIVEPSFRAGLGYSPIKLDLQGSLTIPREARGHLKTPGVCAGQVLAHLEFRIEIRHVVSVDARGDPPYPEK